MITNNYMFRFWSNMRIYYIGLLAILFLEISYSIMVSIVFALYISEVLLIFHDLSIICKFYTIFYKEVFGKHAQAPTAP